MLKSQLLPTSYAENSVTDVRSKQRLQHLRLPFRLHKGFTLAEILITLTIIGVVSSMVIPALIQDTQKADLKISWKKAFGAASQAYKLAMVDNGGNFGPYSNYYDGLSPKWNAMLKHMPIIKSCNGSTFGNCWAKNGVTRQDGTDVGAGCEGVQLASQNTSYANVTSDGMYWLIAGDGSYTYDLIMVDVNGAKGPNMFGKDVFNFSLEASNVAKPSSVGSSGCGYSPEMVDYLTGN